MSVGFVAFRTSLNPENIRRLPFSDRALRARIPSTLITGRYLKGGPCHLFARLRTNLSGNVRKLVLNKGGGLFNLLPVGVPTESNTVLTSEVSPTCDSLTC